ncbi:hypothetical protein Hanom_Chr10g00892211 [Helianthus anomalus]
MFSLLIWNKDIGEVKLTVVFNSNVGSTLSFKESLAKESTSTLLYNPDPLLPPNCWCFFSFISVSALPFSLSRVLFSNNDTFTPAAFVFFPSVS